MLSSNTRLSRVIKLLSLPTLMLSMALKLLWNLDDPSPVPTEEITTTLAGVTPREDVAVEASKVTATLRVTSVAISLARTVAVAVLLVAVAVPRRTMLKQCTKRSC